MGVWFLEFEKWNISYYISKQKMSQSLVIAALSKLRKEKNICHLVAIRLQLLPTVISEENSGCKKRILATQLRCISKV